MCVICDVETLMFKKVPRKTKKAAKKFILQNPIRWTRDERRRFLRAINRQRKAVGFPPIRRMPDFRVSLLEL